VVIISANPETLDGLQSYLQSAGFAARGSRSLDGCDVTSAVAVVLFPDDFTPEAVCVALAGFADRRAGVFQMLVTGSPKKFEHLTEELRNVLVVPRPVWGWTIVDAIRAHYGSP
jgi:hypothetical protein